MSQSVELKVAIYRRVSKRDQLSGSSLSLQSSVCRSAASSQVSGRHSIVDYCDEARSGRTRSGRPELARLVGDLYEYDYVYVYSVSRLARSVRDSIWFLDQVEEAGCKLVSATEHLEVNSAHGYFTFIMLAGLSQFESDLMSERVVAALKYKKSLTPYRRAPYGFSTDSDGGLKDEFSEQKIMKLIFEMRAVNYSYTYIAGQLNDMGYATRRGGRFHVTSVRRIAVLVNDPVVFDLHLLS